jgi:tellurite resistance protein
MSSDLRIMASAAFSAPNGSENGSEKPSTAAVCRCKPDLSSQKNSECPILFESQIGEVSLATGKLTKVLIPKELTALAE